MDLMRLLVSVIHQASQTPNFQTTGTNLAVICLLLPFLHTKITPAQSARGIQLCFVDYPSAILLVLLPASFLLRPAFFWKVSVIITAISLLFNCISGLLRGADQGNQGFPDPSPQEADDDVGVDVETGISLAATPPVGSNQIQGVEARTLSRMLPVILLPVPPALLCNVSVIITALSRLLNSIFGLLRRPNQGNQGVSGISHVRFPGDAIGLPNVGAVQIPEVAVDCEAVGADQITEVYVEARTPSNQENQGVSGISHVRFSGDVIGLPTVGADQISEVAVDCEAVGADQITEVYVEARTPSNQGNPSVGTDHITASALSLLLKCFSGLFRRPDQKNQKQIGRSGAGTPLSDIPLVDTDGDQIPAEAVNDMNDLADGLAQPEAIDVE